MKKVLLCLILISMTLNASRVKSEVYFNLNDASVKTDMIPFSAIAPESFRGHFVRFIHLKTRKSAVAKVIKKEGAHFKTNKSLADAIGVTEVIESVFIEDVY